MERISHFLIALARSSAEAGILVILVLITQWVFRKQLTARWRCALWLVVVARLLLPFSFSSATSVFNLLPRWTPASSASLVSAMPSPTAAESFKPANSTSVPTVAAPSEPMPQISMTEAHPWSWLVAMFSFWLAGVILLAGYVLVSSLGLWRRCARLQTVTHPATLNILHECCARLKVRASPNLLEGVEVSSPALHGLFRPSLLLPKGFTLNFSPTELRFVFLHELAHLKRRDLLLNWVITAVQVLHWFNPLVWFAFGRWRADRELACDAMALEAAGEAQNKDYGRTILRLLESFTHPMNTPGLVGILEDKRQLRRRIAMIASYVPTRGWPRLAFLLIAGLAVIGLTDAQTPSRPATASPTVPTITASILSPRGSLNIGQGSTALNSNPAQKEENAMNKSKITGPVVKAVAAALLALAAPAVTLHAGDTSGPAGTAPAAGGVAAQTDEQQLIDLENRILDAYIKVDVHFLDQVYADDYLDTAPDGSIETKTQTIEELKSGIEKIYSAKNDEYQVRVYGNAAVVIFRSAGKGQYQGKDVSAQVRETDTWIKNAGKWQIVASHESNVVP